MSRIGFSSLYGISLSQRGSHERRPQSAENRGVDAHELVMIVHTQGSWYLSIMRQLTRITRTLSPVTWDSSKASIAGSREAQIIVQ
jgi:hypothetical protein